MMKIQKEKDKKILFYDIETKPNISYTWEKWQTDVIAFKEHWGLLCFAYKWQGETTKVLSLRTHKTEEKLVKELWKLFDEADILVAHNGKSFDTKKSNAMFLRYGLKPPSPYKQIDTKEVSKKYFRFDSNKLDDLGDILGLGRKVQTGGFDLWLGCMKNEKKSWLLMEKYNKQDVDLLEKIYNKMLPFVENIPQVKKDNGICPSCGSDNIQKRGRWSFVVGDFRRMSCMNCGHWFKGDKIDKK